MARDSWVEYVQLPAGTEGPDDGCVARLHEAHVKMTDEGWRLVGTLRNEAHGQTVGAWLFFERDSSVQEDIEQLVAEMEPDDRRTLMERAVSHEALDA